jgi:hypothetical protein
LQLGYLKLFLEIREKEKYQEGTNEVVSALYFTQSPLGDELKRCNA